MSCDVPHCIENKELSIRRYTYFDAQVLFDSLQQNHDRLEDDFPGRLKGAHGVRDVEQFLEQKYLEWERAEGFYFGIWDKDSGSYAGEIALKDFIPEIPSAELGYFLVREFEHKGLMTLAVQLLIPAAFDILKLNKLHVRCSSGNTRSQRVAVRSGFLLEGVIRNTFLCADGRTLLDMFYYGITAEDYGRFSKVW